MSLKKTIKGLLKRLKVGGMVSIAKFILFSVLAVFSYLGLVLIKIVFGKRIVFARITSHRIGHFAANTELFLRRLKSGQYFEPKNIYIGFFREPCCNQQLLKMYKRAWLIFNNNLLTYMLGNTWMRRTEFYYGLPFNSNEYYEFNELKPALSFTDEEKALGKKLLAEMGIKEEDWFICFHSRDSKYLNSARFAYHNYRDCDINNYLKAVEYIAELGGYAIRMGAIIAKPLPKKRHPRIIDYACDYRSDFMDVYLSAHCKFFLGSTAGLALVPQIFSVPMAAANFIPLEFPPIGKNTIFIPKKIFDKKEDRFLRFSEIFDRGIGKSLVTNNYTKKGLEVIENTSEEILGLTQEMNGFIDREFKYSDEDIERQRRYQMLIKPHHHCFGCTSKIGALFLKENIELLA